MSLPERLQARIVALTERRQALSTEVALLETRISKLTLLADGAADDPELEDLIASLAPPPPEPPKQTFIEVPVTPPPPPPIARVRITADKVFALTQRFNHVFQLKHAVALICEDEKITDEGEIRRVRSAVYSTMERLMRDGRLHRDQMGRGKTPALFRKAGLPPGGRWPSFRSAIPDIEVATPTSYANGHAHDGPA